MKPDQVNVLAMTMARNCQQVIDALETGFTRQIVGNVFQANLIDRIDDDVTVIHLVTVPNFDVRTSPDTNAAPDSSPSNSLTKALCEDH